MPRVGCHLLEIPWIPTPPSVVHRALREAWVTEQDVVYDLGCGDGRVPIIAVRDYGVSRGVCVELNPLLVEAARIRAREEGVYHLVDVVEADLYTFPLRGATLVYLYLYQSVLNEIKRRLEEELDVGARVVTLDFRIPGWVPVVVRRFEDEAGRVRTIHVYVVGASDEASRRGERIGWRPGRAFRVLLECGDRRR